MDWVIRMVYAQGGHTVTDNKGHTLRFKTEAAASDEAAMRNMNSKDKTVHYIVVKDP